MKNNPSEMHNRNHQTPIMAFNMTEEMTDSHFKIKSHLLLQ